MSPVRRLVVAAALGLLLLATAVCWSARGVVQEGTTMEYRRIVQRLEGEGPTLERGSPEEDRAVERFRRLLSDFKAPDFRERIAEVYAAELWFDDTLRTIRSREELEEYLGESAAALEVGRVEFLGLAVENGNYFFRWQMELRFASFGGEGPHRSIGMSHVRFDEDGRVALHQDFWDSTGGFFEHVPVVGWMLRRVKSRL